MRGVRGVAYVINGKAVGTRMEFRILGPLEISSSRRAPDLHRVRERSLLAVLLLAPNVVHQTEDLVRRIWDDDPPDGADKTLRSYVSHVRDVLGVEGGRTRLKAESGGYQLKLDPDSVDLHRFRRLRSQAKAIAQSGDIAQADSLLTEAEGLWRGTALSGLPGSWMANMRLSLEEERRSATLERVGLELDLGRHAELTGELERLTASFPLDETCIGYQMTGLYRSGRQADALSLYMEACERFRECGIEPGIGLQTLHRRILQGDPDLMPTAGRRHSWPGARRSALPQIADEFVGREEELLQLMADDRQRTVPVKIITGMAGVGKTTLAVRAASQMAERYPDGQLYLAFNAHVAGEVPLDASGALRSLLEKLGMGFTGKPRSVRELAAVWKREISARRLVVVLDDVPDYSAIKPILPDGGTSLFLVAARNSLLDVPASSVISLNTLPEADAIRLFAQITGPEKAADAESVVKAVRLCGCLPLAIRLTATRIRSDPEVTVSNFITDVENLKIFPDGLDGVSNQIVSAFELSYRGLAVDERTFFRRLGSNHCIDFTVPLAAALTDTPVAEAEAMIKRLLDRHMVGRASRRRFRFHDLLRAYASFCAEREDSRQERRAAERRLLDYLLHSADRADHVLYPHRLRIGANPEPIFEDGAEEDGTQIIEPDDAQKWLEDELPNLHMTVDYAARHEWKADSAEIAHILSEFLDIGGRWDDAISIHGRAMQASRDLDDLPRVARAALDLSRACQGRGWLAEALEHASEALRIYTTLGDRRGTAMAVDHMGMVEYFSGRFRRALAYDEEAMDLYRQSGDEGGEAQATFHAGVSCLELGRLPESAEYLQTALSLFEKSGNDRGKAKTINSLAEIKRHKGYHREAIEYYRQALEIHLRIGARQEQATVTQNIGNVYLYKGSPERAIVEFRNALTTYRDSHDLTRQSYAMCDIGDAYQAMEMYGEALIHYENACDIARQVGNGHVRVVALRGLADSYSRSGNHIKAMEYYDEALALAHELEAPYQQAKILDGIGDAMIRTGELGAGKIYLRQAGDLYRMTGSAEAQLIELRLQVLGVEYPRSRSTG